MTKKDSYCMVTVTCPDRKEAESLAFAILEKKLAACVQLMPIVSFYEWKNKVNKDDEILMIMKTKEELYKRLEVFVVDNHSYEVPEIVKLPVTGGFALYLSWIDDVTAD